MNAPSIWCTTCLNCSVLYEFLPGLWTLSPVLFLKTFYHQLVVTMVKKRFFWARNVPFMANHLAFEARRSKNIRASKLRDLFPLQRYWPLCPVSVTPCVSFNADTVIVYSYDWQGSECGWIVVLVSFFLVVFLVHSVASVVGADCQIPHDVWCSDILCA